MNWTDPILQIWNGRPYAAQAGTEEGDMFTVHCARHGSRVLIFTSGVERIRNADQGIEVDYRCTCGERGTWRTGVA